MLSLLKYRRRIFSILLRLEVRWMDWMQDSLVVVTLSRKSCLRKPQIEHQLNVHSTILKRKSLPVLNSVLSGERRNCFLQIEQIIISNVSLSRWVDCAHKLVLTHGNVECKLNWVFHWSCQNVSYSKFILIFRVNWYSRKSCLRRPNRASTTHTSLF